jgi:hypothetical protein
MELLIDVAPFRRQSGAMNGDSKRGRVQDLDRINLRLSTEIFARIDGCRASRSGNVSRNTWIAEAIEEKLRRENVKPAREEGWRKHA